MPSSSRIVRRSKSSSGSRSKRSISRRSGKRSGGVLSQRAPGNLAYSGAVNGITRFMRAPHTPFPERKFVELPYCETITLASSSALDVYGNQYVWNLNSLFDPNNTGVGHQPMYYDQLTGLYAKYRVYKVEIEVTFFSPGSARALVGGIVTTSQDTATTLTAFRPDNIAEKWSGFIMNPSVDGERKCIVRETFPIWQVEGMTFNQWLADDGYDANVTASPAAIPKLHIAYADLDAPVSTTSITCNVRFVFHAAMYSLITQTQS